MALLRQPARRMKIAILQGDQEFPSGDLLGLLHRIAASVPMWCYALPIRWRRARQFDLPQDQPRHVQPGLAKAPLVAVQIFNEHGNLPG